MGIDEVDWASELQNNLLLYVSPDLDEELTIQYEVANPDGSIEGFYCVIGATKKTSNGVAESPDVVFSLNKETAVSIRQGELTTEEAFLKGLLQLSGEVERLIEAFPSFTQK
tara:strand:+ start:143 stop:478 length:336 start_codon:yes stop_codon:yes gene_type:complete